MGLAVVAVVATAGFAQANSGSIDLHQATAPAGTDCPDTTNAYWHFVFSPNHGYTFGDITLNIGGTSYTFTAPADPSNPDTATEWIPNSGPGGFQFDNVFVEVPAGSQLTDLKTSGSSAIWNDTTAPNQFNLSHVCTGSGGGFNDDLTVSKTAVPSFTVTHSWTIDKSADATTVYSAGGGKSDPVNYTVSVTKTTTNSDYAVNGQITVTNPNQADIDNVSLSDGACVVTPATVDVPAGGSAVADYACPATASDPGPGTNTATATWDATAANTPDGSATGSAGYSFAGVVPTVVGPDTIDVTDTNGQSWHFTGTDSVTYPWTFTDPAGTCTSHDNTATITQTSQDSNTVTVQDCQGADPTVSKTATPTFTRAYTWNVSKSVDKTKVNITSGQAAFNYTVGVSHDSGTDSGWAVSGTITVSNPTDWEDITVDVSDALPGATCTLASSGTDVVVPAGKSVDIDYTCTFASNPVSGTNTATVTWDKDAFHTTDGSATGTKDFTFGAPTTVTDECAAFTDSYAGALGTVCVGDPTTSFGYTRYIDAPPLATCKGYDNTATFTTNDTGATGSASQSVTVCALYDALTPGYWKNHLADAKNSAYKTDCANAGKAGGSCSNNGPWASTYLPISLGNVSVTSIVTVASIFNTMNCSISSDQGAIGCLAGHLLATKLNFANGSPHASCIDTAVAAADAFLKGQAVNGVPGLSPAYTLNGAYTLSAAQRSLVISLKTTFDNYNNAKGC